MRENNHIEKELLFKSNIKDITSISLDSDYKVLENCIEGNFLVSGEYKIHEVSINKEKFDFKIPFKHEISNDIDDRSIKLEITNFIYDYKEDVLIVNIDYEVLGDRKEVLEFTDEESLDEFLQNREVEVIDTRLDEINDIIDVNDIKEDGNTFDNDENIIDNDTNIILDKEEISSDIIDNISSAEDGFITYKVYTLNSNETLESIVIKYHTTLEDLKEYNDLNNLNAGDKIIIPIYE